MKNKKNTVTKMVLIILLCIAAALTVGNFVLEKLKDDRNIKKDMASIYHIQIVTEKERSYFWDGFRKGAQQSADENGMLVEFVESETRTTEDIVSLIKRGVYADVDGIAFRPTDIVECSEAAKMAKESGISVITFESEENVLPMIASVNSDYHQVGFEQGELLIEATGGIGNVAIVMNEKDMQDGEALCNAEKMRGIMECFPDDGKLKIVDYYKVDIERFQTEKTIKKVFEEHPEVDSLICTDAVITKTAADFIKSNGLEEKIRLIGYGNMPEILEDIESGIIYGSVYPDTEVMGYQVVQKLHDILENKGREDIISLEVKVMKGE